MLDVMLDEYYSVRGWDALGQPCPETLQKLGLAEIFITA
jgi:aldehyde:ferredoxin oxidoreductase